MRGLAVLLAFLILAQGAQALALPGAGHGHGDAPLPPEADAVVGGSLFSAETGVHAMRLDGWTPERRDAAQAGEYQLVFDCPPDLQTDEAGDINADGCPSYILDTEDVMSQPVLVVSPRDAQSMAFHAMHGGPGIRTPAQSGLPSSDARADIVHQPHTIFRTTDGGSYWEDDRYYAPASLSGNDRSDPLEDPEHDVFGMDNAITRDHRGDIYSAAVYAYRDFETDDPFEHATVLWSLGDPGDPFDYDQGYVIRKTETQFDEVRDIGMDYIRQGKTAIATWLEAPTNGQGHVRVVYREVDGGTWKQQPPGSAVEGCRELSNPLVVDKQLYIGCFAGKDLDLERFYGPNETVPESKVGRLEVFRMDTETWETTHLGAAPIEQPGNAVIASAENVERGGMVIASAFASEGQTALELTFGNSGERWTEPLNYGSLATAAVNPNSEEARRAVVDARATAVAFVANSGMAHVILAERFAPNDDSSSTAGSNEFAKTYVAVYANSRFMGAWDLGIDDPQAQAAFPAQVAGLSSDVFWGDHDAIVLHKTKNGQERIFVTYGDRGYTRFAEVKEQNPPVAFFAIPPPPPPIPAPLLAGNPALVGAAAGVLSTALVARLIAAKKKSVAEAPSL